MRITMLRAVLLAASLLGCSDARIAALEKRVAELDRALLAARVDLASVANATMRAGVITIDEPSGWRRDRYEPAGRCRCDQ